MAVLAQRFIEEETIDDLIVLIDPEHTRKVDLPRKVGFDKVIVSLRVEQIEWNVLESIVTSETGMAHTLSLRSCRDGEKVLAICENEPQQHWYSDIRIQLASNVFTMKKCNLPNCRDICLFEICINPIEGHECLGNISNLSCEQEQLRVHHMMDTLERYGIHVDRRYAELKKVELNVNLYITESNINFKDAVEMLRPHRHGLKNFTFSDYAKKSNEKDYYIETGSLRSSDDYKVEYLGIKERQKTSFNSIGRSLSIKVYDKSEETMEKSGGYIEWISPITRVEFSITSPNEIPFYLGTNNLFDMTQDNIEVAFHRLSNRFIRIPMMEYYRKVYAAFEKYFEKVNVKEHAWRKNMVMDLDGTIKRTDDFFILADEDLRRLVGLIPNLSEKTSKSRITKSLKEEFKKATCIRIADGWNIGYLLDWLCNCQGEEAQGIIYSIRDVNE